MSSSREPPARNTHSNCVCCLKRHRNHPTIPHRGQQIAEPSEPVVHIEVEQTKVHCLSQINNPGPPDEGGPSQYPEDGEREEISELLDEPQSEPEQLSTTAPMTSVPPGDTIINNPQVGITERRTPSPGIHQDKGKQHIDDEPYMEGPISAQMSEQSLESWLEHISGDLEVLKEGVHK